MISKVQELERRAVVQSVCHAFIKRLDTEKVRRWAIG
jgi:hypothetical protein